MTATTTDVPDATGIESVDSFRLRAREWLAGEHAAPGRPARRRLRNGTRRATSAPWRRARRCSARCGTAASPASASPRSTAASGSRPTHQRAFTEESPATSMPMLAQRADVQHPAARPSSTSAPRSRSARTCPRSCSGEELWVQFLSEPSGGSDLAGCLTRADARRRRVRPQRLEDLEHAAPTRADYALCLARTNWDVPKHRGLTMFIMKIHQPGRARSNRSSRSTASMEFCQEFFDDVRDPGRRRRRRGRRRLDGRHRACCSTSATPSAAARRTSAARGPKGGAARRTMRSSTWSAAPAGRTTPTRAS